MVNLIAFHGRMGSGKSTAIHTLLEKPALAKAKVVKLLKFAQPLYDMQEMIYDRISAVHTRKEDFAKDRKLLQWLGTDWGRETISPTLWVDLWKSEAQDWMSGGCLVVCDDVRFDNEAEAVRAMGGKVVHIIRDNNEAHAHGGVGIVGHASEGGINPNLIDVTIPNKGSIEDFKKSLERLYKELRGE